MARYSISQQQENKKEDKENKKEFDWNKELGIIIKWLVIITSVSGILWKLIGIELQYVLFSTIIFVLLVVIYLQYKKIKILEKNK